MDIGWEDLIHDLTLDLGQLEYQQFVIVEYCTGLDPNPYAQAAPDAAGDWYCELVSSHYLPESAWPIDEFFLVCRWLGSTRSTRGELVAPRGLPRPSGNGLGCSVAFRPGLPGLPGHPLANRSVPTPTHRRGPSARQASGSVRSGRLTTRPPHAWPGAVGEDSEGRSRQPAAPRG